MDKSPIEQLGIGLRALKLEVPEGSPERLWAYAAELLKWNGTYNLTAITREPEVVEKHLLDALTVLPEVRGARSLLDLGAGAGLPGLPLALVLPALSVTCVDTVNKKVVFMKNALARLGLAGRVRAIHARAEGAPEREGLEKAEVVISRAFKDAEAWLELAAAYVADGGRVVAMLGQTPEMAELEQVAGRHGFRVSSRRTLALPFSDDPRGVVVFQRP